MINRGSRYICYSIDDSKFVHTLAPELKERIDEAGLSGLYPEPDKHSRIIADFHHYFPSLISINTVTQLLSLVNMNREVRDWYKLWSLRESQTSIFPDWLDKNSPSDLEAFDSLEQDRLLFSVKNKSWNDRIRISSESLKNTIKQVDSEKKSYMDNLKPLHAINMVSVIHLPIEDQARLALVEDKEERSKLSGELILKYQKRLKGDYDRGAYKNPFSSRG